MKKVLTVGIFLLVVAVVIAGLLSRQKPTAPWFSSVSNGNGYDRLVLAAGQMIGRLSEDKAETAAFVKTNALMFETVESALKLPLEVPATMYSLTNSLLSDLSSFKPIALALRARGRDAEQRGANLEAMSNYVSIIASSTFSVEWVGNGKFPGDEVEHGF